MNWYILAECMRIVVDVGVEKHEQELGRRACSGHRVAERRVLEPRTRRAIPHPQTLRKQQRRRLRNTVHRTHIQIYTYREWSE